MMPLRINLGCGRHTLEGWFCIDVVQHPAASRPLDLVSDVKSINLPSGCASELMAIHLWEHLYRWECDEVIIEWRRLLQPQGKLIMEMPDLFKFCRNILEGRQDGVHHPDQMGLWAMYGDPTHKDPLMCHRWGWTFNTLSVFLKEHGFREIRQAERTQWHPNGRHNRDFRIEAMKS